MRKCRFSAIAAISIAAQLGHAEPLEITASRQKTEASSAAVSNPSRFAMPQIVAAIRTGRLASLRSGDAVMNTLVGTYLVGFGLWLDRACDFLPATTRQALFPALDAISVLYKTNDAAAGLLKTLDMGASDAKLYLGKKNCAAGETKVAMETLIKSFH